MIDQRTLNGLAFPTASVHYNGTTSSYVATVKRDGQRFTGRAPYDYVDRNVSREAAVWAAMDKATAEPLDRASHCIVWGDLDVSGYVAVIVPNDLIGA